MPTPVLAFNWQNIADGDGVSLAITGITIVFTGLVLIAGFIASLPRLLAAWDRWRALRVSARAEPPAADALPSPEVQAALAWVALRELEVFQLGDQQRLTFKPLRAPGLWSTLSAGRAVDPVSPCVATNSSSTTDR